MMAAPVLIHGGPGPPQEEQCMSDELAGSITQCIAAVKAGDHEAAGELWRRFHEELLRVARARLPSGARTVADEEDAALSAFWSFCEGAVQQKFPLLAERHDLQALLLIITARKAAKQALRERRLKRGGDKVFEGLGRDGADAIEDPAPGSNPEISATVADERKHLLDRLGDETLSRIARLKMEGYTIDEIARQLGCARRTVARRLGLIRSIWLEMESE
jgi:DNA-directed RNA polymerase specialized sigma24 family protein